MQGALQMLQVRLVEALIYEDKNRAGHPRVRHRDKAWPPVPHLHIIHSCGRELWPLEQVLLAGHHEFSLAAVELLADDALPLPRADQDITVQVHIRTAVKATLWIALHDLRARRHLPPRGNQSPKPQAGGIEQLLLLQHLVRGELDVGVVEAVALER
uniref:Uncharacterized protein n=1 Tax=Arundo donax TaxID=35708 RepID=A0A0A9EZ18_ARUDO